VHERQLHLILVRRDLTGYQHVHPHLAADGTWSLPVTFPAAGTYRAFADFAPEGAGPLTLGVDVDVPGAYAPEPLPEESTSATVDGYTVELEGQVHAGESSTVTVRVSRDGRPVTGLQPYLGAYGHLVALRDGDLAYLHVHPQGDATDAATPPGPEVTFSVAAPSAGAYRLFFDFKHAGIVRTAAFTIDARSAA